MRQKRVATLLFFSIFSLLLLASPVAGEPQVDNIWIGNSTLWSTPGNWSLASVPTSLSDVVIPSAPAGGNFPIVSIPSVVLSNLTVESGATLDLSDSDLTVNNMLVNNGTLMRTVQVADDGTGGKAYGFFDTGDYGGLILTPGLGADLGLTTVKIHGNQECDGANSTVRRCFDIDPTTINAMSIVTAAFGYASSEINGNTCGSVVPFRWDGAAWQAVGFVSVQSCAGEPKSVTTIGISDFSRFSLSDASPTALNLSGLQATAAVPRTALLVGLAGVLGLLSLYFWSRRYSPDGT